MYKVTDGNKAAPSWNFMKIWDDEKLESDLESYIKDLLKLMDALIKKYSRDYDCFEYSKKEELWMKINTSKDLNEFINSELTKKIVDKYGISKVE